MRGQAGARDEYREDDARAVYDHIPTRGPYPGVTEALNRPADVYKPRLRAFECMSDKPGVALDEIVHVSASPMYDLRLAAITGIKSKVYVDRGFEHDEYWLGYERIIDITHLSTSARPFTHQ